VRRRPPFVWLVVLLCSVYSALFAWAAVVSVRYYGTVKVSGWSARPANDGWFVTIVDPAGGAAGQLHTGDRLLALGGDRRAEVLGSRLIGNIPGGSTYRVDVERQGRQASMNLTMTVARGQLLWPVFQLIGLAFFLCGASLALLRPNDPQVRLVGGTLMAVAFTTLLEAEDPARRFIATPFDRGVQLAIASLALFTFPMAYQFFSRFPAWTRPGRLSRSPRRTAAGAERTWTGARTSYRREGR